MSKFSSALVLTDLNDYVSPGQACIKPVEVTKEEGAAATEIRVERDGSYVEVNSSGSSKRLKTAQITLNDCLACSGCITSAESVLIEAQSHHELYKVLDALKASSGNNAASSGGTASDIGSTNAAPNESLVIISLSPQSRASFAAKYHLTPLQVARRLTAFFKHLGCYAVYDTSFGRDLAILESQREFVRRYNAQKTSSLPMLASTCPGWICYAEKKHGTFILPYISSTKSSQQVMGSIVKSFLAEKLNKPANKIYHVAIMPCYDKKLEASRQDFYDDVLRTRDVDLVLTTGEVETMLAEQSVNIESADEVDLDHDFSKVDDSGSALLGTEGSSAGGFLEHIFRYAAKELFNVDVAKVNFKQVRGTDYQEATLEVNGEVVLRFATSYGFRNIQNFVRKIKSSKAKEFHMVEIMACPSACINGGGQLKDTSATGTDTDKALVTAADTLYRSLPYQAPQDNQRANALYKAWIGDDGAKAERYLHTVYHAVADNINKSGLSVQW